MNKYFRSQIIPFDRGTTVYWGERADGKDFDIDPNDIPIYSKITDISYAGSEYQLVKDKNGIHRI